MATKSRMSLGVYSVILLLGLGVVSGMTMGAALSLGIENGALFLVSLVLLAISILGFVILGIICAVREGKSIVKTAFEAAWEAIKLVASFARPY